MSLERAMTRLNSQGANILLSPQLIAGCTAKQNGLGSSFPGRFSGGDGGELNPLSKHTYRRMYYRLSRCSFLFALDSHRQDSSALALWSLMAIRRRSSSPHPAYSTPVSDPTRRNQADDASLVIKQRERKKLPVWQLLFCRLFNESAYRHLDLQFYNLPACRNPTSPG